MALVVGGTTVTGTQVLDATKLSGNLPALNASSLTNIPAIGTTPTTGSWTIVQLEQIQALVVQWIM